MEPEVSNYQIREKVKKSLRIETVAKELLGQPVSNHSSAKWDLVYKSFYNDEKTPSFKISTKLQVYHCFSSNEHGDVIKLFHDFEEKKNNVQLSMMDACEMLIKRFELNLKIEEKSNKSKSKYSLKEKKILELYHWIMNLANYNMMSVNLGETYLRGRGITTDIINTFNLGFIDSQEQISRIIQNKSLEFSEEELIDLHIYNENAQFQLLNKILIPISDEEGNIISIVGRSLSNDTPKYKQISINDQIKGYEHLKPNHYLYNMNNALNYIRSYNEIIIVEGYFDVMRLYNLGIYHVVAAQTVSLTREQISILKEISPNIVFLFDGDKPGQEAQRTYLEKLSEMESSNNFIFNKVYYYFNEDYLKGDDPDSFLKNLDKAEFDTIFTKFDFRDECIKDSIEKYMQGKDYSMDDLYNDVGRYINFYNPYYIGVLKKIIDDEDKLKGDINIFEHYFYRDKQIQSLYLMSKLNAEQFYCENLLNKSEDFVEEFRCYSKFMDNIRSWLKSNFSDNKVNYYNSTKKRKLYGERSTKLVIDVYDRQDKDCRILTLELDYINGILSYLKRFDKQIQGRKIRNQRNFFDAKLYENIGDIKKHEEILTEIKSYIEEAINKQGEQMEVAINE